MAPLHDTDLAEQRWSQAEWEHYELWEKVEQTLRRRRRTWILFTALIFLGLAAIPSVQDLYPRWKALAATRKLAGDVNWIKREVSLRKGAIRLRFPEASADRFIIERANTCRDTTWTFDREGMLSSPHGPELALLRPAAGQSVGLPGLVEQFCYDSLTGVSSVGDSAVIYGFAVIPAKDLAIGRLDRAALLSFVGSNGELSFSPAGI